MLAFSSPCGIETFTNFRPELLYPAWRFCHMATHFYFTPELHLTDHGGRCPSIKVDHP
jgi:hypothetical protein